MSNKLRILFTIPNFDTAGSGLALFNIAKQLDKSLFDPQIACLHNRGVIFQKIKKSGIKIHIIDLYKEARPITRMLKECYDLSKVFKKINPQIIHSYHYGADYTEAIAAKIAGIKWIYTKKSMSWYGPSYRGWKLRSFLSDGIICQNSDMMQLFFRNWKKVKLIPIGVDPSDYSLLPPKKNIKKKWGIEENDRIIISIANLVPVKGIEVLIEAFKLIFSNLHNWKLMIVGNDLTEYGIELKNNYLIKEKLNDRIIFTGKQNNIRELLDISEIYVQSTLNEGRIEGAPIAILEAMVNKKVIIGSDVPGIRDQLKAFPNHLFKASNSTMLSEKLFFFMNKTKHENHEIGEKFYNFVVKNYNISNEKQMIQQYYNQILL